MDIININNLLAEGLVTNTFTADDFLIIVKRDLTPGGDGYRQFAIPATAFGGSGSQTLAQTLTIGNLTGEQLITSDNGFSTLSVLNVSNQMLFNDGFGGFGSVKIGSIRTIIEHALQNRFDAPDNNFPQETASSLTYFDIAKNLKPVTLGNDLTLVAGVLSSNFSGNTLLTCITDIFVTNINSCSPLNINPTNGQNINMVTAGGIVNMGDVSQPFNQWLQYSAGTLKVNRNSTTSLDWNGNELYLNGLQGGTGGGSYLRFTAIPARNYYLITANASGRLGFSSTGGYADMQLSSNGNLFIGTDVSGFDATAKLHVQGDSSTAGIFALKIKNSSDESLLYVDNSASISMGKTITPDPLYTLTMIAKAGAGGALRLLNSAFGDMINIFDNGNVHFGNTTRIAFGGTASSTIRVYIKGTAPTTDYGLYVTDTGETARNLLVRNDGLISTNVVQPLYATLVAGDLYYDTAANILSNGDLVVGRKV